MSRNTANTNKSDEQVGFFFLGGTIYIYHIYISIWYGWIMVYPGGSLVPQVIQAPEGQDVRIEFFSRGGMCHKQMGINEPSISSQQVVAGCTIMTHKHNHHNHKSHTIISYWYPSLWHVKSRKHVHMGWISLFKSWVEEGTSGAIFCRFTVSSDLKRQSTFCSWSSYLGTISDGYIVVIKFRLPTWVFFKHERPSSTNRHQLSMIFHFYYQAELRVRTMTFLSFILMIMIDYAVCGFRALSLRVSSSVSACFNSFVPNWVWHMAHFLQEPCASRFVRTRKCNHITNACCSSTVNTLDFVQRRGGAFANWWWRATWPEPKAARFGVSWSFWCSFSRWRTHKEEPFSWSDLCTFA